VAGWCYSWLVGLSAGSDSWTAVPDTRRLQVPENPNLMAVRQIRAVLPGLGPLAQAALFAFDAGYDPVQLSVELAGKAQIVTWVRDDRAYYARPVLVLGVPGHRGLQVLVGRVSELGCMPACDQL
jgi:hypothetical protein